MSHGHELEREGGRIEFRVSTSDFIGSDFAGSCTIIEKQKLREDFDTPWRDDVT